MAIDALLAKRPPTPPLLATALDDDDDEEGIESVDGTLSQLLQAEAAVAEAEAEAAGERDCAEVKGGGGWRADGQTT